MKTLKLIEILKLRQVKDLLIVFFHLIMFISAVTSIFIYLIFIFTEYNNDFYLLLSAIFFIITTFTYKSFNNSLSRIFNRIIERKNKKDEPNKSE